MNDLVEAQRAKRIVHIGVCSWEDGLLSFRSEVYCGLEPVDESNNLAGPRDERVLYTQPLYSLKAWYQTYTVCPTCMDTYLNKLAMDGVFLENMIMIGEARDLVEQALRDQAHAGAMKNRRQEAPTMTVTRDQLPAPISPAEAIDEHGGDEPPFETLPEPGVPPGLPARTPLTVHQLLQLGATQPEGGRITSPVLKEHLAHQEQVYACYSKEELVAELVRRDAGLIKQGQEAADGRMAGRLLREFVRGILYSADQADLNQTQEMLAKGEQIDSILRMLGAEPAPKRDLRVNGGTTLGPIGPVSMIDQSPEKAIQDLSDLSRRQFPSEKAADEIRNKER